MSDCQNVIDDYGNTCGDEGRSCDACSEARMREHAWLAKMPKSYVTGIMGDDDRQDIIDAGRGHLLL